MSRFRGLHSRVLKAPGVALWKAAERRGHQQAINLFAVFRDIRRGICKQYSAEDKIRIVLDGLSDKVSVAELCRREGIAESLYYSWSREFLGAGSRRLAGDAARSATTSEVKDLKRQALELKEVDAEQALELRLPKKAYARAMA